MEYTKKEFGALTGQKTKDLSNYIKRGKVIVNGLGLIDSDEDVNVAFMASHYRKDVDDDLDDTDLDPATTSATRNKPKNKDFPEFDDGWRGQTDSRGYPVFPKEKTQPGKSGVPAISVSEKAFKHWQAEKYRIDGQLRELEFQKKMGSLIPTELMGAVISQQAKSFSSSFRQALSRMCDMLVTRYKLTGADAADMRKLVVDTVNKSIETALADSKREIKAIARDFSEKKKLELPE